MVLLVQSRSFLASTSGWQNADALQLRAHATYQGSRSPASPLLGLVSRRVCHAGSFVDANSKSQSLLSPIKPYNYILHRNGIDCLEPANISQTRHQIMTCKQ